MGCEPAKALPPPGAEIVRERVPGLTPWAKVFRASALGFWFAEDGKSGNRSRALMSSQEMKLMLVAQVYWQEDLCHRAYQVSQSRSL